MTLQELIVKIGSDVSGYVSGIDQAISKGAAAEASFKSIGTTLSATLTVPLTAIGGAALKAASDLKEASNLMRVETGKTGDALAGLNDSFKTVFAEVPTSAKSAADAIATLSQRLGLAGKPLEELSTQLLELAKITGSDVKPMVETTAKLFNEWQVATTKQADALDYLFKVSQNSGIGISKLESELTDFGPTLKNLGFNLQDAALLLGQLDKAGVDAASVMPGLRKEFATLAKAGIDGADAFNKIVAGIKNGSITLKQALDIFGQKSGGAIFRDIIEGKFGLNDMKAAVNANSDTILKAAKDTRTMSDEMKLAWNQVEISLQPLGDVLKAAFKAGFEDAKPLLGIVHDLGEEFKALPPKTQNTIVAIGAVVAAAGPAALAIAGISTAIGTIGPAVAAAAPALGTIAFAVASLKFSGAIDEMIRFGSVVKTSFGELDYALKPAREEIQAIIAAMADIAGFGELSKSAQSFLSDLISLKTAGQVLFQAIAPWASATRDAMKLVSDQLENIVAIIEYVTGRYKGMEDTARGLASALTSVTNANISAIAGPIAAVPTLKTAPTKTTGNAAGAGSGIDLSGIGKSAKDAVLSLDQLIEKNAELNAALTKAQSVYDEVTKRVEAGTAANNLQSEALKQLIKARKAMNDVELDSKNIAQELEQSASTLIDRTAAQVKATDELAAKYGAADLVVQESMKTRDGFLQQLGMTIEQFRNLGDQLKTSAQAHDFLSGHVQSLGHAFQEMGITSSAALKDLRDRLQADYDAIRLSGIASAGDIAKAQEKLQEANNTYRDSLTPLAEAYKTLGVTSSQMWQDMLDKATKAYGTIQASGTASAADLQHAWQALKDLNDQFRASLDTLGDAFKRLGITSSEQLGKQADQARRDYDLISGSGRASSGDISRAWDALQSANQKYHDSLTGTTTAISDMGPAAEKASSQMITCFDSATSAAAKLRAAVASSVTLDQAVAAKYNTGTLDQALHGASGKDWQNTMSTGALPLAGPGVPGYAYHRQGTGYSVEYFPDGLPTFSGSDKSTPKSTGTSGTTSAPSTPTVVPATPATLTQTTIDQLVMVLQNLNTTLSDLAKAISGGVGVSGSITQAANQATGTLTASAGQTSTALDTLQTGLTSTGTAAASAIGSLTTSVGDMTGAIDQAFTWAKNQLLGQGYTEAQIDAVAAQAKEIVSKIDFSKGADSVIAQLQSILQSLGLGGDAVNALILQMKDQFGSQLTPAVQDGTAAVQGFSAALGTAANSLSGSNATAIQDELRKLLASGMSFENAVSALGGTVQNGEAIFSSVNDAFAGLGDSVAQLGSTLKGITGGEFGPAFQTFSMADQIPPGSGSSVQTAFQDNAVPPKGMWQPEGGPQVQTFSYDEHIQPGWGNNVVTTFNDPHLGGSYKDQGSGGTGQGMTGGIPPKPYTPPLPPLNGEWNPLTVTPPRAFNASDYLPAPTANAYVPAPGSLSTGPQVVINNPTVLNRSMLDLMVSQIQDLGIGRNF